MCDDNSWALYGDVGYTRLDDAHATIEHVKTLGAIPVGIIEGATEGTWGLLYWHTRVLYDNHRLSNSDGFFTAALLAGRRVRPQWEGRQP